MASRRPTGRCCHVSGAYAFSQSGIKVGSWRCSSGKVLKVGRLVLVIGMGGFFLVCGFRFARMVAVGGRLRRFDALLIMVAELLFLVGLIVTTARRHNTVEHLNRVAHLLERLLPNKL